MAESDNSALIAEIKAMPEYDGDDTQKESPPPSIEQEETKEAPEKTEETSDENPAEPREEGDPIDEKTVKVKVGDEEQEITVAELKNGYLRQSDYTKKTQEAAALRSAHVESVEYLNTLIGHIAQNFKNSLLVTEEAQIEKTLDGVDPRELSPDDRDLYHQYRDRLDILKRMNADKRKEVEELIKSRNAEQARLIETTRQVESGKLLQVLPEMNDPGKRKAEQERVTRFLDAHYGADGKAIAHNITDHRDFMTMRYAAIGYEYLNKKLPSKPLAQPGKNFRNDGKRDDLTEVGAGKAASKILRTIKSRGEHAAATDDEVLSFISSLGD